MQCIVSLDSGTVQRLTMGCAPDNHVPLAWEGQRPACARELVLAGGNWVLSDHGLSRNGTWVNCEWCWRRREDGADVVRVGATHIRFRMPHLEDFGITAPDSSGPPEASLSPAQRRVLIALCRPLAGGDEYATAATNQQIADELFLSVDAVKTHLRALFAKFGVEQLGRTRSAARSLRMLYLRRDHRDELGER